MEDEFAERIRPDAKGTETCLAGKWSHTLSAERIRPDAKGTETGRGSSYRNIVTPLREFAPMRRGLKQSVGDFAEAEACY